MNVYNEEQEGFRPLRVPPTYPKRRFTRKHKGTIYNKIKCAARSGVHSIAGPCAFDHMQFVRSQAYVRSIICNAFDHEM